MRVSIDSFLVKDALLWKLNKRHVQVLNVDIWFIYNAKFTISYLQFNIQNLFLS
jgi:hypothetical protein